MNLSDVDKIDSKTREQAWRIALSVEWTAADWKTFYQGVTASFVVIAARQAKQKMWEFENVKPGDAVIVDENRG